MRPSRLLHSGILLFFVALLGAACSRKEAAEAPHVTLSWMTDYNAALAKAKAEHKLVLLNFTGSDWCPGCVRMDEEVFNTQAFKDYADQKLVLMMVDFPLGKELPEALAKQNFDLRDKYEVVPLPTFIVLDPEGKKIGQFAGYQKGGPQSFIAELNKLAPKS